MYKLVISGAAGIIGSSIVHFAIQQNIECICIVRSTSKRISNIPQSPLVKIIFAELSNYSSLQPEITDCDTFIHLAWTEPFGAGRDDTYTQVLNMQYTLDAVHLAHRMGCKKFIGVGSQAEYGPTDAKLTPTMKVNPESGYGIAKYAAGKLASLLCRQLNLSYNWIRIISIFGEKDAQYTLISYVINELKNNRSPALTACEQTWDYLYSDDAGRAILAVAQKGVDGKVYPLGSGDGKKLSEYLEIIQKLVNPSIPLGFGQKPYFPHQPMYLVADISTLTKDTGWKPQVSFEDGIKAVLQAQKDKEAQNG